EVETISGSASVMHSASGLFVNAAAGKVDGVAGNGVLFVGPITGNEYAFPWIDPRAVHVQAGVEKNFFGFGNTTLLGEWANAESKLPVGNDKIDLEFWGLGVNQAIDGAAMDLYVSYRHYDLGLKGSPDDGGVDADALVGGAVIRF